METTSDSEKKRDPRWHRIAANVPFEVLMAVAQSSKNHKIENLTKGDEALVDELFRVASEDKLQALYDEFPGPDNFAVWFYDTAVQVKHADLTGRINSKIPPEYLKGIEPEIGGRPQLYKLEHLR